jgi:hypothetical protein
VVDTLTAQVARAYDRLRAVRSITTALGIYQATATGYTQIEEDIIAGFYFEFVTDRVTGEQFLQVLIAESSQWTITDMSTKAAAVVLNSKRHKINGKRQPEGAPLVWLLTCSATGETV